MPKKVCIIGGGAAGLVSARVALQYGLEVDIFEQTSKIGGTWVYSDEIGCHTSMYKIMKTNLPKEAMLFENTPFDDNLPSFMSHEDVLEYLEKFAESLKIPIRFETKVVNVERVDESWKVTYIHNSIEEDGLYDAVLVCNGHFFEPLNPYEPSVFQGEILHSHDYRRAEKYKGKRVVIIGAGPSGIDIAMQVEKFAESTTLISKKATYTIDESVKIRQIPFHVKEIQKNSVLVEEKEEKIETDVIIICTGYIFKFPFLSEDLIEVKHNGMVVSPLWNHLSHVNYPDSLFFIGLPLATITFQLFEVQAKYASAVITGHASLPSQSELLDFEKNRLSKIASAAQYHCLVEEQWEMLDELAELGNFEKWKYLETIRKLYIYIITERRKNVVNYKNVNFKLNSDETDFEVV
ncbi:unnamed protein product [Caenorhabditis angaria]|uniref:Flavin-containing monooxygenase n=1 Tax=Caenorhabditis angaria TaxID=860376 RepID=A0A9P1MTE8_9PELO|nr:unnamed protein product [Caenorhabditis angaria]